MPRSQGRRERRLVPFCLVSPSPETFSIGCKPAARSRQAFNFSVGLPMPSFILLVADCHSSLASKVSRITCPVP